MKQIFTWGFGQKYPNCYTIIEAPTRGECRAEMFRQYGTKWSFQYDSEEAAGVKKYNLKEIK